MPLNRGPLNRGPTVYQFFGQRLKICFATNSCVFLEKLIFGNFFVIHESYSVFRVVKCGLGSFDFICGLVWLIFIKIYTMEQIAVKKP